ncbi:MAG: Metal dependent phosphohydrolase [Parcubacteria group bacterium GW2011_GWA2_43_17]|nr:MAG: Metal dependent phosphohydrolase [Parcubacteria group bacterium GW2011_GWA2_43_17]KKT91061.1 MAG: Metal dependent phosphohydrolase [Parcubacteria group bacterium GW2011_GWF2_45_11]KKT98135.1 MAG: Metal dependent phosphohydrolase [Parcubacteria group bacterium GW2011_GWC2_45_15]OGY92329.1 MAG: phosphohydrolase [Candidatus Komeilibacteria bacterium RIFOXYA2_FULL_45_9]OGY95001.1 MAG: phosphohydrolase [Candidatus Komeilibacteria bacterium RIFOXYC2_FULL_45_12]HAH04486.1 phosphohydrolase [Ca
MTREETLALVKQKIKSEKLIKHCLAVEAIMRSIADHFKEDAELWGLTGLLHDIDYEETKDKPEEHSLKGAEILQELGLAPEIIQAVKVHNEMHGLPRESLLDKVLFAVDPLAGFITAVALVCPSKKLADVEVKSIVKRLKESRFAAGASRTGLKSIEELGLEFKQFAEIGLRAMKNIAEDLGL